MKDISQYFNESHKIKLTEFYNNKNLKLHLQILNCAVIDKRFRSLNYFDI